MEQLRVDDGASPFVALATWKDHRNDRWWSHVMVVPVTQNGTTSYNVETMEWTVYGSSVKAFQFEDEWKPEKVCNFATVEKAAEFLMDFLKTSAPFWKSEERAGGDSSSTSWVDAQAHDDNAAARWKK